MEVITPSLEIHGYARERVREKTSTVDDTFDKSREMRGRNKHAKPAETIHVPSKVYRTEKRQFCGIIELFAGEASIL